MRSFLPFCLLKTALKSEFVGQNLLENNVLNGKFFHRFCLFHIKENRLLSRVWGICDLDFIEFFNRIRFEYLYLLDCYKWNVKIRYYELLSFEVDIYHCFLPYLPVKAFKAFTQLDKLHSRIQFFDIDFERRHQFINFCFRSFSIILLLNRMEAFFHKFSLLFFRRLNIEIISTVKHLVR